MKISGAGVLGRPWARFDDLSTGTALVCPNPDRILIANRVEEVAEVLDHVQRATDGGRWPSGMSGTRRPIIRAIEPRPRGVYCGAIGLVGPPSAPTRARFNVAIRTAVIDSHTGAAEYGVGGGITWPSQAPAEHAELLAKTAVLNEHLHEFGAAGG